MYGGTECCELGVLAVPSYPPIEAGPRRTVRRGLQGMDLGELWAGGL
ncbi:hypothetical protein ACWET9_30005 [Streptomyces sp. NPDC004059]